MVDVVSDHKPTKFTKFLGLWARGADEDCPANHLLLANNIIDNHYGFTTRPPTRYARTFSFSGGSETIVRVFRYEHTSGNRLVILTNARKFYDADGASPSTPILTIAGSGAIDASCYSMFGRLYISPHDGSTGLSGEFVYVYTGTGSARKAAAAAPTTSPAAADGAAGDVEPGKYIIAVAYETDSGFITKYGGTTYTVYTAPGAKKINLTAIPTGPSGTSKRHILASKTILDTVNATNQDEFELFFVPSGTINDNTTTTLTINFFAANLTRSADYLLDNLTEIPAGLNIGEFQGSMIVVGEYANPSIARVSKTGEPESFSSIDGFVLCTPGSGGTITNLREFRGSLYLFKSFRTFVTQATSSTPSEWPVDLVDGAHGCEAFGIAEILDSTGGNIDRLVVVTHGGVLEFNGAYNDFALTYKIEALWSSLVSTTLFKSYEISIDPIAKRIYITTSLKTGLLVGSFTDGLSYQAIKWYRWSFGSTYPTSILIDVNTTDGTSYLNLASSQTKDLFKLNYPSTNKYRDDSSSSTTIPIASSAQTTYAPEADGVDRHLNFVRIFADGYGGTLAVSIGSENRAISTTKNFALDSNQVRRPYEYALDLVSSRFCVYLNCGTNSGSSANEWMDINKIFIYTKPIWATRPM